MAISRDWYGVKTSNLILILVTSVQVLSAHQVDFLTKLGKIVPNIFSPGFMDNIWQTMRSAFIFKSKKLHIMDVHLWIEHTLLTENNTVFFGE